MGVSNVQSLTEHSLSTMNTLARAMLWCLALPILLSSMFQGTAQAHELRPAVADVSPIQQQGVLISVRVNLEAIVAGIGPEHDNTDNAEQSARYQTLRASSPADLKASFDAMPTAFLSMLSVVNADNGPLKAYVDNINIPPIGDTRLPRDTLLSLSIPDETALQGMSWQWNEQLGPLIIRTADEQQSFSQYLKPGQRSDVFSLVNGSQQTNTHRFFDYIVIGIEHIVPKGLDHILFVIGLFLLAPAFKPVLWQVSAFTLAHTLTLGLGISGYINLPPSLVEPLIALSITAICVENLFKQQVGKFRLALVFGFGLLHGLGFAGVLGEIGLPQGQFFQALLAFNIGVELGQLLVLFLCFAVVGWWFGRKSWYRTFITQPASCVLGAVGLFWFFQRIGLLAQ